jgi:hypothetical protein
VNAIFQHRDAEAQRRDEILFSLAPGFSQVIDADGMGKPFQRFLRAGSKPLKRFVRHAVVNTRLKPGANEKVMVKASANTLLKIAPFLAALLTTIGAYAQGSLTLNTGETYTYQFSSLSLQGTWNVQDPPGVPMGRVDGLFVPGSFQPGSSLLVEVFEDTTSSAPIASQTLNSPVGFPAPLGPLFWSLDAWQDLQGAVRVSMLSGSATMYLFQVTANRNDSGVLNSYGSSALPVPEPNSISLVSVAALLATLMKSRRRAFAPLR